MITMSSGACFGGGGLGRLRERKREEERERERERDETRVDERCEGLFFFSKEPWR
jgi:hypothetical protein